jgi:hypothetical protein
VGRFGRKATLRSESCSWFSVPGLGLYQFEFLALPQCAETPAILEGSVCKELGTGNPKPPNPAFYFVPLAEF